MKDRIVLSVPIAPDMAHQARITAAMLNISRVELIRRAVNDFIKSTSITASPEPTGGNHVRANELSKTV